MSRLTFFLYKGLPAVCMTIPKHMEHDNTYCVIGGMKIGPHGLAPIAGFVAKEHFKEHALYIPPSDMTFLFNQDHVDDATRNAIEEQYDKMLSPIDLPTKGGIIV